MQQKDSTTVHGHRDGMHERRPKHKKAKHRGGREEGGDVSDVAKNNDAEEHKDSVKKRFSFPKLHKRRSQKSKKRTLEKQKKDRERHSLDEEKPNLSGREEEDEEVFKFDKPFFARVFTETGSLEGESDEGRKKRRNSAAVQLQ